MKPIFHYSDYRGFLRDFHDHKKETTSSFSYRYLSEKAGINSSGFYPSIISGKRDLTASTILKTCVALNLSETEAEFFEALVQFNQAKTLTQKNKLFEVLMELRNKSEQVQMAPSGYDFFDQWYHPVIRELVVSRDFGEDFRALGKMLKPTITGKQARQSVELLLKLGFLKREGKGYAQTQPILNANQDLKSHQLLNYQVKMFQMAIEALDRFGPQDLLSNSSSTFSLSKESFALFQEKLRECRRELMNLAENEVNPQDVYQLNINLFPLTNPRTRTGKK